MMKVERLKCMYCTPLTKIYNRQNRKTGVYKVMRTSSNHLIFICIRCHGRFKGLLMGSFLEERDMNPDELKQLEGDYGTSKKRTRSRIV